jgi:hypothetical protein
MTRIEIDVSPELAARLERYQRELPHLLQRGLDEVERERDAEGSGRQITPMSTTWREQWQALAEDVAQLWPAETSALETLAAMRR